MRLLSRKSCSSEKSMPVAILDGSQFRKALHVKDLKIKYKPYPKNFKAVLVAALHCFSLIMPKLTPKRYYVLFSKVGSGSGRWVSDPFPWLQKIPFGSYNYTLHNFFFFYLYLCFRQVLRRFGRYRSPNIPK
jgi:hypothetical protein